jgi:hypothetical protein
MLGGSCNEKSRLGHFAHYQKNIRWLKVDTHKSFKRNKENNTLTCAVFMNISIKSKMPPLPYLLKPPSVGISLSSD